MNGKERTERGAAEERSESPVTETEVRASQRPAGEGDQPTEREGKKKVDEEDIQTNDLGEAEGM